MKCYICGEDAGEYGNNPNPLIRYDEEGDITYKVCDNCNMSYIIPYRVLEYRDHDTFEYINNMPLVDRLIYWKRVCNR